MNALFASLAGLGLGGGKEGGGRRNLLAGGGGAGGGGMLGGLWPSVIVLKVEELAPVEEVREGNSLNLVLQNFDLRWGDVVVELVQAGRVGGGREGAMLGLRGTTTLVTLDKKRAPATDNGAAAEEEDGIEEVGVVAPAPVNGAVSMRCFVRASYVGLPGIYAMSNAFTLRRRAGGE